MLTRITLALGVLGATLSFASPALAKAPKPPTLYVATNGSDTNAGGGDNTCRISSNPCATIQHAIGDAPSPATISVASGTYVEQLTITGKNLSIVGAGTSKTIIAAPSTLATTTNDPNHPNTPQADIVTFDGAASGGLSDLAVDGSQFTETDCGTNYVGVFMLDSSGTLSSVDVTQVQHDSGSFGCQAGANGGVLVANADGNSHTVTMFGLFVDQYTKDGITCRNIGTTCVINSAVVTGIGPTGATAQNGIELYGMTAAKVTNTTVSGNTYTSPDNTASNPAAYNASGILVINVGTLSLTGNTAAQNDVNIDAIADQNAYAQGATQGVWTISGNTVAQATNDTGQADGSVAVGFGEGIGDGLDLYNPTTVKVTKNTIEGNDGYGIGLYGVTDSHIGGSSMGNTVEENAYDGIYLGEYAAGAPSTGDTIADNTASENGNDGIFADAPDSGGNQQSTANTFTANTLKDNTTYDAVDSSTGMGTAGTADTWKSNVCKPAGDSVPSGLCKK